MPQLSYRSSHAAQPLLGRTIGADFDRIAARHAEREAVVSIHQNLRCTYGEFAVAVDRLARGLIALGVAKGDRVGIWAVNNAEWIQLQIATAKVGAVLVNINPAYRVGELGHALRAARIQTLFLMPSFRSSDYVGMVRKVVPEAETAAADALACEALPELRHLVLYDPAAASTAAPTAAFLTWNEVLGRGAEVSAEALAERAASLDVDDPINIQFTSGTTGFAKPVVLTHHNILNNGYFVAEEMGLSEVDRLCVPVPFYHCFGMVLSNLACLTHGAAIVLPASHFEPRSCLEAVEKERCTALHGVPTMFVAELELEDFESFDLSSLRTGLMAGAPCPPELMRKVIGKMGIAEILIAYGQTEASPVTHITRKDDSFERRVGTVGTNLPHQECKIVDPATGTTLPIGEVGELCFRGYHVMRGYFEMPEATAEVIDAAGWLHSGDLGVMDADGYARITGRLKDMIIRGGENIYPAEIEAHLMEHPEIIQAAVFGIADGKFGEEVGAWIQLRHPPSEGERQAEIEALRAWARERLAHFKVPRYWKIVEEFPMTVTGKVRKIEIREMVERELGAA